MATLIIIFITAALLFRDLLVTYTAIFTGRLRRKLRLHHPTYPPKAAIRAGCRFLVSHLRYQTTIALIQPYDKRVAAEAFQVWTLKADLVRKTGTLTCEDGNGHKVLEKALEFTDFPLPEITLRFTDNTILLPSEY